MLQTTFPSLTRGASRLLLSTPLLVASVAAAADVEVVAQASSDWMYHGLSETRGQPTFGLAADWQISARAFAGVELHQAVVKGRPQRQRSVMVYAGLGYPIGERFYASVNVQHREFPKAVKEWDFTEFEARLNHDSGWNLAVAFSPDYYEHNTRSVAAELGYRRQLTENFYAYAGVGLMEFSEDARFTDYRFGQVGGGYQLHRWVLDVAYRRNSEGPDTEFGRETYSSPKVVASLTWRLR